MDDETKREITRNLEIIDDILIAIGEDHVEYAHITHEARMAIDAIYLQL